jgi:hypothetical protein
LKINLKIIEEYNKKKQIKTSKNSEKSGILSSKKSIDKIDLEFNDMSNGNLMYSLNKKKSGITTISSSVKATNQQNLNQSFSLRNI